MPVVNKYLGLFLTSKKLKCTLKVQKYPEVFCNSCTHHKSVRVLDVHTLSSYFRTLTW